MSEKEQNAFQRLILKLKKNLAGRVDIFEEEQNTMDNFQKISFESFRTLQKTTFFVLILGDFNKASFSLVQFGWALAHCKHLMIVYKKENVSNRFEAVEKMRVEKKAYKNINKEFDDIFIAIRRFVSGDQDP